MSRSSIFDTKHVEARLRQATIRGSIATFFAQISRVSIGLISLAVLARLLRPADFGLFAMAATLVGLVSVVKDLGLTNAVVQTPTIEHKHVSNLFWVNLCFGAALAGLLASLAPVAADFYGDARLVELIRSLSLVFIVDSAGAQHRAILRRRMELKKLALIETAGYAGGAISAITVAAATQTYWALTAPLIATSVLTTSALFVFCPWRPSAPIRDVPIRSLLSFGGYLSTFNVLTYLFRNLDNVLIGRYLGAVHLGVYANAYSLLMLPVSQINAPLTAVAIPALSRLGASPDIFVRFYKRALELTCLVTMPAIVFMLIEARTIVLLIFGEQWIDVVDVFRALGPAAFIGAVNIATGWVYLSLGNVKRQLIAGLFNSTFTAISFVIGINYGIIGVAYALSASMVLLRIPSIIYCYRGTPLRFCDFMHAVWRPTLASIISGFVLLFLGDPLFVVGSLLAEVCISGIFYVVFFFATIYCMPGGRSFVVDTLKLRSYVFEEH